MAPGAGSETITFKPLERNKVAQLAPITPVPTRPIVLIGMVALGIMLEKKYVPSSANCRGMNVNCDLKPNCTSHI